MLIDRSALALVNGQLWDLHRPLEEDCTVELAHFHMDDPFHMVSKTFKKIISLLFLFWLFLNNYFIYKFRKSYVKRNLYIQ